MKEFEFKPPKGSVYVTFVEGEPETTSSGLTVPAAKNPRRNMVAKITECGELTESLEVGTDIIFNRSRAVMIKEGTYCVKEEFIDAVCVGKVTVG